jgi:hypothetical protein
MRGRKVPADQEQMDFHMTIVDQQRRIEFDLWNVQSISDGRLIFGGGGWTAIDGSGLRSGAVAAHWGNLAGLIRAEELRAGRIDHKLMASTHCVSGTLHPARGTTLECSDKGLSNRNAPALGQLLRLEYSDAEIDRLPVASWKKAIARAAARYGIIIGDQGSGGRSFALAFESGNTFESFGYDDPFVTLAREERLPSHVDEAIGRTTYRYDIASGIDWSRLVVMAPCVALRTCKGDRSARPRSARR